MAPRRTLLPLLVAMCLLTPTLPGVGSSVTAVMHLGALQESSFPLHLTLAKAGSQPPPDAACRAAFGSPCYSPREIQHAYGVDQLLSRGDTGAGETIVIVDSYGSPTMAADLETFDHDYGLPDPPSFQVLAPLGTVPWNPADAGMLSWGIETTLDVEWAHAMAPEASIDLLTSPVNETEGVQGMPQFLALEQYALDHHLGQVISQSWGATENTLFTPAGRQVFRSFEKLYERAAAMGVTVLASAGDSGSSNVDTNNVTYPFPTVGFPASSPLVTAVGGTSLHADTSGTYQTETVWNESAISEGAGGGGISQVFKEPPYQEASLPRADQRELDGARGLPDISWNADPSTGILIYASLPGLPPGYYLLGGTSEGSPQWAGLVSDLNQLIGRPIGFLNPYLYALGASGLGTASFHDITVGNNSYLGIPGYAATPGWDLASGWGTPDVGGLLAAIASMAHQHRDDAPPGAGDGRGD
jgi:subtilase family serine protease